MKNFVVLGVTVVLLYLGYDLMQAPPDAPAPAPARMAMAPAPPPAPKLYFHSALDAPAMRTSMSTGASYFSTDPNSRFVGGYGYNTNAAGLNLGGGGTYDVLTPSKSTTSVDTSHLSHAAISAPQTQSSHLHERPASKLSPSAEETAR